MLYDKESGEWRPRYGYKVRRDYANSVARLWLTQRDTCGHTVLRSTALSVTPPRYVLTSHTF